MEFLDKTIVPSGTSYQKHSNPNWIFKYIGFQMLFLSLNFKTFSIMTGKIHFFWNMEV
jgi:hypothetical protein